MTRPTPLVITAALLAAALPALLAPPAALAGDAPKAEAAAKPAADATPAASTKLPAFAADVLATMDKSADPCTDFYRYACGGWLDTTELPGDQTRWARSFSVIRERNREIVRTMLEAAAANPPAEKAADPDRAKIGTFYAACMDEPAIEKVGAEPLAPMLAKVDAAADPAGLFTLTGELHHADVEAFFGAGVLPDFKNPGVNIAFLSQGGLGLPDRDYYLSDDPKQVEIRTAYGKHVARMLGLLGGEPAAAEADAARVVAFETRLAGSSRTRTEMRDVEKLYNKLDLPGLKELTPTLPWDRYLAGLGHPGIVDINVATPEFFQSLAGLVAETDPATLRAYLRWQVVNAAAPYLSKPFVDADFEFYGATLSGQKEIEPRWKRCVDATENALGEAVGRVYAADHFAGASKQIALEMIGDVEASFEANLPKLAWMDDATRARAVDKEHAIANKIGYPDEWRDYGKLAVGKSYFGNVLAANAFESDRQLAKIAKPVDRGEWRMTPQTVNAGYNPLLNDITFPAGILQPPFFSKDFPAAMNYGAIGTVVGHELTHGFDDQGRKFDPSGEMHEWWAPEVGTKFDQRAQCVDDFYSKFEIEPGLNVNGKLTLGENIADLGGIKQSYQAYKSWETRHGAHEPAVPGLTNDQLFFVAFGQVWCSLVTPEAARVRARVDPHSPPQFRAVGPLANTPAFAAAFECAPGTPMNPADRCEVW